MRFNKAIHLSVLSTLLAFGGIHSSHATGMNSLSGVKTSFDSSEANLFGDSPIMNTGFAIEVGDALPGGSMSKRDVRKRKKKTVKRVYKKRRVKSVVRTYRAPKKRRTVVRQAPAKRIYSTPSARTAFSQAVLDQQTQLNQLGFNAGNPDGLMGRKTRSAINQFQAVNGLAQTGELSPEGFALLSQQVAVASAPPTQPVVTQQQAVPQAVAVQPAAAQPAVVGTVPAQPVQSQSVIAQPTVAQTVFRPVTPQPSAVSESLAPQQTTPATQGSGATLGVAPATPQEQTNPSVPQW